MMLFLLPLAVIGAYLFKKQQDAMLLPPGQPTQPEQQGDPSMAMFAPEQSPTFVPEEQPIARGPIHINAPPPLSQRLAGGQTTMKQTAISKLLKPSITSYVRAGGTAINKAPVRIK